VHILITGAASGIGKELINCFAREKEAILSLVDINEQGLKDIASRSQVPAYAYTLDLADVDAVPSVLHRIEKEHGPIDVLINCAGIMFIQSMAGTPWEKGLQLLNIDLLSPLRLINLVLPSMIERHKGHIVNISSMAGVTTIPGCCYYGAAKSGLGLASEILRGEVKRYGIGVTTVYLGPIKTPLEAQCRTEVRGNIYSDHIPTGSPQRTADLIYQAVKKNRALVIYTRAYWFVRRIQRIANWFVLRMGPDPKI
jgi:dehydrogenase/reductase SDR family member 7B